MNYRKSILYINPLLIILLIAGIFFSSCEKKLDNRAFGELNSNNFPKSANDATAAVTAMYSGMMQNSVWNGWGPTQTAYTTQAGQTTDEAICNWDDGGSWKRLNGLVFTPDFGALTTHYTSLIRYVSNITALIPAVQAISMDEKLRNQYVGELKALRAYYMQIMYLYYGPVPARLNADDVNNPNAPTMPKPSKEEMVANIEKDFKDAIAVLPDKFTGSDYGRFSKAACYTSLMKLYMQEKRWQDAIDAGTNVKTIGFSLVVPYENLFNINNKGGNSETILAIVCTGGTSGTNGNGYRPHYLPTDYYDPIVGDFDDKWGGYRMPWKTYDKFSKTDYRLKLLQQTYPTMVKGTVVMRDARAGGDIGAVMNKYGPDPSKTDVDLSQVDIPVMRYADVELLLAEAINELHGPTSEAYGYINDVRTKHGQLAGLSGLDQAGFRKAIQNERLFELWAEGVRRDDLIRWGIFIQRAKDDGFSNVDDHLILYPLPRAVVNQSNGVIAQNPGYN